MISAGRTELEQRELQRWRDLAISLLRSADVPVIAEADMSKDPEAYIMAALGTIRSSTLRRRVREWSKFTFWLDLTN